MPANPAYIPTKKADLRAWAVNFAARLTADEAGYGIEPADSAAINAVVTPWVAAYDLTQDPGTRTPAAIADADAKQAAMLVVVRPFAVTISANADVTDELKSEAGVTIRSTVRTPVSVPTALPLLAVVAATVGAAKVRVNNSESPTSKKVPDGCAGIEVFAKFGADYTNDPAAASYIGRFTRFPFNLDTAGKSGLKASVFARYVTKNGNGGAALSGPFSAPLQFVAL